MRLFLSVVLVACVAGCGDDNNNQSPADLSAAAADMAMTGGGGGDMTLITPYNMPGSVYCYGQLTCSTTSATPVCCDARNPDGGFSDSCVASSQACAGGDAYECGQAADCGSGMVCCGMTGTSKSGKVFLNSTTCATSCTAAQIQLCVSKSECKTGTTCFGEALSGRDIGVCK